MTLESLGWFMVAGVLLNLTPGPDVLYILRHALRDGARAGVVAALGINAGVLVHMAAAALGVGALLASSALAFTLLKWVGAAYLVVMGLRLVLGKASAVELPAGRASADAPARWLAAQVFRQGFLTNALNPKVALFFLAFVPQFIAPGTEHKALAFIGLGLLFVLNSLWVNIGWAVAAAALVRRATALQRALRWMDRVAGSMFIGFGAKLALTDNPVA
ncbi:MAG: LysE family translocator [Rhodoferax sp.]